MKKIGIYKYIYLGPCVAKEKAIEYPRTTLNNLCDGKVISSKETIKRAKILSLFFDCRFFSFMGIAGL